MSTFNLIRNSRVFFTTKIDATTKEVLTGPSGNAHSNLTTFELQVMDGFTFSQATNADTITLSEAGNNPVRGQRSFNTSLGNVEFSFSTYVRPKLASGIVSCEERVLWNALLSDQPLTSTSVSITPHATHTVAAAAAIAGQSGNRVTIAVATTVQTNVTAGHIYNVTGVVGAGASKANNPVKVISCSSTVLVLEYLTSQGLTGTLTPANWTVAKLSSTAWNEYPAISLDTTGPVNSALNPVPYSVLNTALSNRNQLQPFGMIMVVDNATYLIDNCAMDQAVLDFGLDGIAMIAWTGKGTALRSLSDAAATTFDTANNFSSANAGAVQGSYLAKDTTAQFITNKLSTVALSSTIFGAGSGAVNYTLALTGGSVTIANGITFVTPANLGIVNKPIGYFTGTRAVTGSLTAYLRTGSLGTAELLRTLLANSSTDTDPEFKILVDVGGSSNGTKVAIEIPAAMVQIPTIDAQAVMSTNITFTGQGSSYDAQASAAYDIESPSEINFKYFAA